MTSLSNRHIKELAALQGFDLCGITPGKHFAENEAYFKAWLEKGYNSSLGYMGRYLDRRFDVRRLVEGAQTVVVCAISYKNRVSEGYPQEFRTRVASYACTRDYHQTIKEMLSALAGERTVAEAAEEIKLRSRQYAKRQLTWLRRNQAIHWILWKKERDFPRALQISTEILRAAGLG